MKLPDFAWSIPEDRIQHVSIIDMLIALISTFIALPTIGFTLATIFKFLVGEDSVLVTIFSGVMFTGFYAWMFAIPAFLIAIIAKRHGLVGYLSASVTGFLLGGIPIPMMIAMDGFRHLDIQDLISILFTLFTLGSIGLVYAFFSWLVLRYLCPDAFTKSSQQS